MQSFSSHLKVCLHLFSCVFGDAWRLLIYFPRQLFVKFCLVFTARMCLEWFCWSAGDLWADPRKPQLTGSACLNVESRKESQASSQPSDLTLCSERSHKTSLSITGHSMSRLKKKKEEADVQLGAAIFWPGGHTRRANTSVFFFFFF